MESETGKSLTPGSGMNRGQILDGVFMMGSSGEGPLGRQLSRNATFSCHVTKLVAKSASSPQEREGREPHRGQSLPQNSKETPLWWNEGKKSETQRHAL